MARKGRDLEKLVAYLEECIAPKGFKIQSPEKIMGKNSGIYREVDVSLRGSVGTSEILIIFECRDRNAIEDLTWIEQLKTKKEDVGADKAIAISSKGFSNSAKTIAGLHGVELRTLYELDLSPDDILCWPEMPIIWTMHTKLKHTYINLENLDNIELEFPPHIIEFFAKERPDSKVQVFIRKKDGCGACLDDLRSTLRIPPSVISSIPFDGSKISHKFHCVFDDKDDRFQISTTSGPIDIDYIDFYVELWRTVQKNPLKGIKIYEKGGIKMAQSTQFEIEDDRATLLLSIHELPTIGTKNITARVISCKK